MHDLWAGRANKRSDPLLTTCRREPVYKRVNTAATLRDDPTLVTEIALAAWKPTGRATNRQIRQVLCRSHSALLVHSGLFFAACCWRALAPGKRLGNRQRMPIATCR
jgi:hypothetical protein